MSDDEHTTRVQAWVNGYLQAWNSNDPDTIGALFTENAAYYTEPHSQPWRGRNEIVRQWLHRKDKPGETQFRWHPLTVSAELAVVQGTTVYRDPPRTYSNLWLIRLDPDGRCTEFTEWWMQHP
jgi:uncharacterized protein (TIGR02246 family)